MIRPARPSDGPRLRCLEAAVARVAFPDPDDPSSTVRVERDLAAWVASEGLAEFSDWFDGLIDDPGHLWRVAESSGVIVGFIHGHCLGGVARIQGLYIDQNWWGCGLSDRLMIEFDCWANDTAASLVVLAHNRRAIRFYTKHGFIIDPPEHCVIPGVIFMSRLPRPW